MKKIALIENFAEDFVNSRLRYALYLKQNGYDVYAIIPQSELSKDIISSGIKVIQTKGDPRNRSSLGILYYARILFKIFKHEKFDIIHLYRLQPNLIGSLVARLSSKKILIINHITGLGLAFTSKKPSYLFVQEFIRLSYSFNAYILSAKIITQNTEDPKDLRLEKKCHIVRGSAVNESLFNPQKKIKPQINETITLLFVSRLIKQKGIIELIDAVEELNLSSEKEIILNIVGWIDERNPDSLTEKEIEKFNNSSKIIFHGRQKNIYNFIQKVDICILPTFYREGVPRFLLESMAAAKPIITTKQPGCRELISPGLNGYHIESRDKSSIKKAIHQTCRLDFIKAGEESFKLYSQNYSESIVYSELEKLYT